MKRSSNFISIPISSCEGYILICVENPIFPSPVISFPPPYFFLHLLLSFSAIYISTLSRAHTVYPCGRFTDKRQIRLYRVHRSCRGTTNLYTRYLQYPHRNDIKVGAMSEIWGEPTSLPRPHLLRFLWFVRLAVLLEIEWSRRARFDE